MYMYKVSKWIQKHVPTVSNMHILFCKQAVCKRSIRMEKGLLENDKQ